MSHQKPKEPALPAERSATVRKQILSLLTEGTWTARALSAEVGASEKDVYDHLEHLRRSMHAQTQRLAVLPAECRKCGYVFDTRERLTRPGKCPVCRGEAIHPPGFTLEPEEKT